MSRYTGPKARINRRLGGQIFESAGALRATNRKPEPPGMHPRPRKVSTYGESMREKQKIKYYYGLGERQLRKLFDQAGRMSGNTGENLLLLCERRLDSVVRLSGLTHTRPQARQGVSHGHFTVNGRFCDIPSAQVRAGDVIHVKRRQNIVGLYRGRVAEFNGQTADWLAFDEENLKVIVHRLPTAEDITLPVSVEMVVELMSR
ncbi:30S ribosomal protein S4 [Pseudobythopirellula maris]|uniref:Small ribosomal subunit protein uS4 n=1 Tax=Pseudobythopirellula maris TaxID=2527991 RepID=A0A5C5ZV14_9BACT|nr:30S ribosomal protein S4 [Pseudobythopirellula maris]TWT90761.1 30S ribosomal protein S4 [Pseudobythopirellula maris]